MGTPGEGEDVIMIDMEHGGLRPGRANGRAQAGDRHVSATRRHVTQRHFGCYAQTVDFH
jgi:hypothetical protein